MEKLTSIAGATVMCAGTVAAAVWCAAYAWDKTEHARNSIYRWSKRVAVADRQAATGEIRASWDRAYPPRGTDL